MMDQVQVYFPEIAQVYFPIQVPVLSFSNLLYFILSIRGFVRRMEGIKIEAVVALSQLADLTDCDTELLDFRHHLFPEMFFHTLPSSPSSTNIIFFHSLPNHIAFKQLVCFS